MSASTVAGASPAAAEPAPFVPTDEQATAIEAPLRPLLLVAGAGTGKTTVMARRILHLVQSGAVRADQVLGLTFTNKAAAELAGRLRGALLKAGIAEAADGEPTVSTYHAFAGRLVTEHGLRLGVEPRSRLLADATRYQLAARVLRRHRGPITHLTSPLNMLVGDLVSLEAELSEHLVDAEELGGTAGAVEQPVDLVVGAGGVVVEQGQAPGPGLAGHQHGVVDG